MKLKELEDNIWNKSMTACMWNYVSPEERVVPYSDIQMVIKQFKEIERENQILKKKLDCSIVYSDY
jgi:hypothetical protein